MPKPLSKYRFQELPDGFVVEGRDRRSTVVRRTATGFWFGDWRQRQLKLFDVDDPVDEPYRSQEQGLYYYSWLVSGVAAHLMYDWTAPNGGYPPYEVRQRVKANTRRAIGHRVHQQWKRLVEGADSRIAAVQKAVFAATGPGERNLLREPSLYQNKYLVRDILRLRSAAAMVGAVEDFFEPAAPQITGPLETEAAEEWREFVVLRADAHEHYVHPVPDQCQASSEEEYWAALVERLSHWQDLCSPTGRSYRSLRRTLAAWPGGIPSSLMRLLPAVTLERPITRRLELVAVLLAADFDRANDDELSPMVRLMMHTPHAEIANAMEIVSREIGEPLRHRRTADVGRLILYLLDYPEPHRGRLAGLARRAVRWHRAHPREPEQYAEFDTGLESALEDRTPTSLPPIPPPAEDGIVLLRDLREVRQHGLEMGHCIGSSNYCSAAVEGRSYLFSVSCGEDRASAEVEANGRLRQVCGPNNVNTNNKAVVRARRVLGDWGSQLRGARR